MNLILILNNEFLLSANDHVLRLSYIQAQSVCFEPGIQPRQITDHYFFKFIKIRTLKTYVCTGCPNKRLPFEVKRQCRMFEFECLNSLMSPGMRKTLELGFFMLTLRINLRTFGLIGDLKHSNSNMRH